MAQADDPVAEGMPPEVALLVQLLKFATLLNRPMSDAVATPEGVSPNELRVLMALGGERQAAGHALAELIGMQPMNVSRALAGLHARGWVEPVEDASNRRRKPFRLSAAGWAAHEAMTPEMKAVADFIFADLTMAERTRLDRIVGKMIRRTTAWEKPAAA